MNVSDFFNQASEFSMEGLIDEVEGEKLYELACEVKDNCIVEIGSYRGKSTNCLALGAMHNDRNVPVFAIDPHGDFFSFDHGPGWSSEDRVQFFRNIHRTGASNVVRLINLDAFKAFKSWDKPISFLFIDGDHKFENINRDFWMWETFVPIGGIIALHDTNQVGVNTVLQGAITMIDVDKGTPIRFDLIGKVNSLAILRKKDIRLQ